MQQQKQYNKCNKYNAETEVNYIYLLVANLLRYVYAKNYENQLTLQSYKQ